MRCVAPVFAITDGNIFWRRYHVALQTYSVRQKSTVPVAIASLSHDGGLVESLERLRGLGLRVFESAGTVQPLDMSHFNVQLDIEWTIHMRIGHEVCEPNRLVSILISGVISRSPDLRRCELSHVMSSAFCLKLVSFLEPLHLGSLRHARFVCVHAVPRRRHCVT
jgi:hypothetical protein